MYVPLFSVQHPPPLLEVYGHHAVIINIFGLINDSIYIRQSSLEGNCIVEGRHVTVKLLLLIYGRLDRRALRVRKPISSSAGSQAFYSSIVCTSTL